MAAATATAMVTDATIKSITVDTKAAIARWRLRRWPLCPCLHE
jgi:hypothetical protein